MNKPDSTPQSDVDACLDRIREGDPDGLNGLFSALYQELHARALRVMGAQNGNTLQATALLNEAYLRLKGAGGPWSDRHHFLLTASSAMRHTLIDHARSKNSSKRPGGRVDIELDTIVREFNDRAVDLLELNDALEALAERDPLMVQVVELKFFAGATMAEISTIVDRPQRSLERDWATVRNWLYGQLLEN